MPVLPCVLPPTSLIGDFGGPQCRSWVSSSVPPIVAHTAFRRWQSFGLDTTPEGPVPKLRATLAEAGMSSYIVAVEGWCDAAGAVCLDELQDEVETICADLELPQAEGRRLRRALAGQPLLLASRSAQPTTTSVTPVPPWLKQPAHSALPVLQRSLGSGMDPHLQRQDHDAPQLGQFREPREQGISQDPHLQQQEHDAPQVGQLRQQHEQEYAYSASGSPGCLGISAPGMIQRLQSIGHSMEHSVPSLRGSPAEAKLHKALTTRASGLCQSAGSARLHCQGLHRSCTESPFAAARSHAVPAQRW